MTRIVNFCCFALLILAGWSISYSLAHADTCLTQTELIDKVEFEGWFIVFNGDRMHLSKEQPTSSPYFTVTVTQVWAKVGDFYCPINGGYMS